MAERMLVFGGHTGTATNDLWELDVGSGEWELKVRAQTLATPGFARDWRTVRCHVQLPPRAVAQRAVG